MTWRVGTVVGRRQESATAVTLVLQVPGWPGHLAGQHVDVRLTAEDGYTATRSYSVASAPDGERVELVVESVVDGEVSPYLTGAVVVGDPLELRGPVGGWFVWRPEQTEPVTLVAGGSGVVPLAAMLRARARAGSDADVRLVYSVRSADQLCFGDELRALAGDGFTPVYTRTAPPGWPRPAARLDAATLAGATWPADRHPSCYVCGPTGFVEAVADLLIEAGHDPARVRTERFGPSGGNG